MDVKQSFSSQGYFLGVYIIFFTLTSLYAQEKKILWKEFTSYYENGLLHERGQLISEKKSGTWITYSIQGKIQSLYNFTNDVKSGQYAEWDVYGRLTREGQFNKDRKSTRLNSSH